MWFILLILKQANKKQDVDNAYVMLTFVEKMEELCDFLDMIWSFFLGNRDIHKLVT